MILDFQNDSINTLGVGLYFPNPISNNVNRLKRIFFPYSPSSNINASQRCEISTGLDFTVNNILRKNKYQVILIV